MKTKKRTTFLTVWLILIIISSSLGLIMNIFYSILIYNDVQNELIEAILAVSLVWSIYITNILMMLHLIFVISIFKWKKWGLYGYLAAWLIGNLLALIIKANILYIVFSIIGPLILLLAIKPNWKNFE